MEKYKPTSTAIRLTETQVKLIKSEVAKLFGERAAVYLFGSRVNAAAKGGDIDLYIELSEPLPNALALSLKLNGALQLAFGMQKIDILTHAPGQPLQPVHRQALQKGVLL